MSHTVDDLQDLFDAFEEGRIATFGINYNGGGSGHARGRWRVGVLDDGGGGKGGGGGGGQGGGDEGSDKGKGK
eukprot:4264419-Karenia_brevis.AAC.1